MTAPVVKVTGARELSSALKQVAARLPREFIATGREAAQLVAAEARQRAPKRTGRLERTIRPGATAKRAVVRAGSTAVPYAGPIHFGWPARGIKAQPFLHDALDARAPQVVATYTRGLQQLIDQAGLGH